VSAGTPIVLAEPTAPVLARETSTNATETTTPPSLAVPSEVVQPSQIPTPLRQPKRRRNLFLPAAVTQPAPSPETTDKPETKPTPRLEEIMSAKLMEADRLYLEGQFAVAENSTGRSKLLCKESSDQLPEPFLTLPSYPQQVRCTGVKQAGRTLKINQSPGTAAVGEQYPEFVPGHLRLAQALQAYDHPKEALEVLEQQRCILLSPI